MCGIAGVALFTTQAPPEASRLRAMSDTLYHRGPDDAGLEIRGNVGLAMRRLAIIDVAGGHQPVFNEDKNVCAVLNGEIYNFQELRNGLESQGHHFATACDTEVIVHLWEQYGPSFVERLNGMFAIAVHDLRNQKLLLARDHLGIKPLFYAIDRKRLVFGSEIKALLASGLIEKKLDLNSLGQLLAWEYVPGEETLLQSVKKLAPGHTLQVDLDSGRAKLDEYWDVPLDVVADGHATRLDDWHDIVDEQIRLSVQRQLISDVPLGAFLSGGVDSSLVVAAMGPARTFSIGFEESSYNELQWAKLAAQSLQVEHSFAVLNPGIVDLFDHLMQFMDDPIGDFSIFPTYLVSQFARQHVTVALTGDGGDELFGGYDTYLAQQKAAQWEKVPRLLRHRVLEPAIRAATPTKKKKGLINLAKRFVEGFDQEDDLGHARWRVFVGTAMREQLFRPEVLPLLTTPVGWHIERFRRKAAHRDELDRSLYVDLKSYLVDNCLVKIDRMSMAASLEARVPLLDKNLVETAFRVPSCYKIANGQTKLLLKRIAATKVPARCVYRSKQGFSIPIKNWLRREFRPLLEELLAPQRLAAEGIFDVSTVERLKQEHLENRANHSHVLWSLMIFQEWRRRWQV